MQLPNGYHRGAGENNIVIHDTEAQTGAVDEETDFGTSVIGNADGIVGNGPGGGPRLAVPPVVLRANSNHHYTRLAPIWPLTRRVVWNPVWTSQNNS